MILFLQIVCLIFTLYTLHTYVITETHSKVHNLLPLVMGLVCIYNLYQVIISVAKDAQILVILKDLLILQMLYLLIFYMLNFLHIKISWFYEKMLFFSLLCVNGYMIWETLIGEKYSIYFVVGLCTYDTIIAGLALYAYIKLSFSKKERKVERWLLLAAFLPSITDLMRFTNNEQFKNGCMAVALMISFAILLYLLKTGQLADTATFLQENWFDESDTPIFLFDTDCFFLDANEAAKKMYPQLKNMTRKKRNLTIMDHVKALSENPKQNQEVEIEGRYYKYVLTKQYDYGKHKGYILSMIDITNQKEETNLMERLKGEAERQSRRKSRFLARMSHDMRSPMHSIIEVSNILSRRRDISERNKTLISYVRDAGNVMLGLMNTMLEFSKLQDGKLKLNERVYHFERMIEDLSNISVINLYSQTVHFSATIKGAHPRTLLGDDIRVREILHSIISNAVRLTNEGNIDCNFNMSVCPDDRVHVVCSVRTSGTTLTEEQIQHILATIEQYDEEEEQEGDGLALNIVMQLLELLGGNICFENDDASGFTLTVSFYQKLAENKLYPEVSYTTESVLEKADYEEETVSLDYVYPDAKLLIADDMRINREIFMEQIKPWQCEVDCAIDGLQAVEAAKKKSYHMIFLDQMMPNMNGIEAAKQIKEIQPDASIIIMTGDAQADIWEDARKAGVDNYLAKPYDMTSLQRILEQYLGKELRHISRGRKEQMMFEQESNQRGIRKVLKTFLEEVGDFEEHMKEYARNDLETFRIKTHGVKGVCKQLNKIRMGEAAEIMEMAAKTGNTVFISDHLDKFQSDVCKLSEQIRIQLSKMTPEHKSETSEYNMEELWLQLKQGFDQYNLDKIDEAVKRLSYMDLSELEQDILDQAGVFYEDLEYEQGSQLIKSFLEKRNG